MKKLNSVVRAMNQLRCGLSVLAGAGSHHLYRYIRRLEIAHAARSDDSRRLDYLQSLNERPGYTNRVILRNSTTGRGWRLHETELPDAVESVREAIDNAMGGGL